MNDLLGDINILYNRKKNIESLVELVNGKSVEGFKDVTLIGIIYNGTKETDFETYIGNNDVLIIYNENFEEYLDKNCNPGAQNGKMRQYRTDNKCKPIKAKCLGIPTGIMPDEKVITDIYGNAQSYKNIIDLSIQGILDCIKRDGIKYILWAINQEGNLGLNVFANNTNAKIISKYISEKLRGHFPKKMYYPKGNVKNHGKFIEEEDMKKIRNKSSLSDIKTEILHNKTNIENIFLFSDHLPVYTSIGIFGEKINVGTYNVLFQKWLDNNIHSNNLVNDHQGHIGKCFGHLAKISKHERIMGVFKTINDLLTNQNLHILGLQELDPNFIMDLPDDYKLIVPNKTMSGYKINEENILLNAERNDIQAIIYNSKKLECNLSGIHLKYYTENGKPKINKRIINIPFKLKHNNKVSEEFRFINTHVQWEKSDPSKGENYVSSELETYVKGINKPKGYKKQTVIIVGDMNSVNIPLGVDNHELSNTYLGSQIKYSHIDTKCNLVLYDRIWTKVVQ